MPPSLAIRPLLSGAALFAGLLAASGASAEWTYSEVARGAGEPATHIAVTSREYHGVGLRCDGSAVSVQYLTNDPMDGEQLERFNASGPSLNLKAGAQARRLTGEMQRVPQGLVFVAAAEPELLETLSGASGELEVSIDFSGRQTHQRTFAMEGSGPALKTLRENCAP
ncbi:hypothetical protein [Aureimonas mangrovi]|uniref:hypothetical protein n=1 Tax=Aureimonas mangrovi TaxID=2758041 RepID=UPI00163DA302|nr:hypothetical protein [Aureimonas mangrovi]